MAVKGAGNVTVTYNSNAVTNYVNSLQVEAAINELEATNFGSTANEYAPGLADWTTSFDIINWDSTVDGYLAPDIVSPGTQRTLAIAFDDSAGNTVTYTWTSKAFLTNGGWSSEATGATTSNYSIRCNGAPNRAVS